MQWFKHYSNASDSMKLQKIIDKFGLEGYGRYWLLLELLCSKFDGENTVIKLHTKEVLKKLEMRLNSSLKTFSDFLNSTEILSVDFENLSVLVVECPILLELQSKDFAYEKTKRVLHDPKNKDKRIKNKNNIKTNKKTESIDLNFELIYNAYPKKEGKQKGLDKLKREIKTREEYDELEKAVSNYAKKCQVEKIEPRFIKQFSSFVSSWRDYVDYVPFVQSGHQSGQVKKKTVSEIAQEQINNNPFRRAEAV